MNTKNVKPACRDCWHFEIQDEHWGRCTYYPPLPGQPMPKTAPSNRCSKFDRRESESEGFTEEEQELLDGMDAGGAK